MIAIVSPSKTMKEEPVKLRTTKPRLLKDTEVLADELRTFDVHTLESLMGISEDLAALNFTRFQNFKEATAYPALYLFRGDVFRGIDADTLDPEKVRYLNKHLRILSGLYGCLRPLDAIKPYRLEMGTRLETSRGKDLYAFWGDKVQKLLEKDAEDGILVNLASKEYSKVIREKALQLKVYDVEFRDYKSGTYKIISFYAKVARGEMARFMADHQVRTVEELKAFDYSGYQYNAHYSGGDTLVFTRG